jgi:hypothetical protein
MGNAINIRIDDSLKAVWNIEDPIYKVAISDVNGTIPSTINKPTDIDNGVIASEIEYLRLLSISLVKQIFINQATGEFLKFQLEKYFGSVRLEGETDAAWLSRVIRLIFRPRVSRASIIYALRPFSSQEPEIRTSASESCFADVSFADRYKTYTTTYKGIAFHVFTAISQNYDSSYYSIIITLYNSSSSNILSIIDTINNYIAAGISYSLEIKYV